MNESLELKDSTVLHKPALTAWRREDIHFFLDAGSPNWIAADERGARVLDWIDGKRDLSSLARLYADEYRLDQGKAWLHVRSFVRDAMARGIVLASPSRGPAYLGRGNHLRPERLKEFWVHLTQTCNLSCGHCLVSSGPAGERGRDKDFYLRAIREARELGAERFYFTGGEPFTRPDIFELIRAAAEGEKAELIILTNATLFQGEKLENLKGLDRKKVKFQVSLDGTTAGTNDSIRGRGVFEKTSGGLKTLADLGFETSLTAVAAKANLNELEDLPALAKKLGAKSVHLMWPHKRGRVLEGGHPDFFPSNGELLELARKVKRSARNLGVVFDNVESLKTRVNGRPNVKYDLGNQCWESLCLYADGRLYPSAATAGHAPLSLGRLNGQGIRPLWLESELAQKVRQTSLIHKEKSSKDPFRFLTGGGDIEHAYFFSANGHDGSFSAEDPYYGLYVELIKDLMEDLARAKRDALNRRSGFDSPVVLHAMGEDAVACSEDARDWLEADGYGSVRLLHSNCVLSFDVEKSYGAIRKFYGKAAEKPREELCCPVKYDSSEINHIPKEVIDRFYGCGSPITMARVAEGETVLDLGSGAGIDCFIAAKKTGPKGKVIGVDMTRQMLDMALGSKEAVARNLGYDSVEFREGYLESIPAEDRSADLVTSNCVINLSPDKNKVFSEIWRILKDNGRLVVADIVADRPVPLSLQAHQDLWGECISGSLSEEEFLAQLEKAGFYGISLLKKSFWKEVEGVKFYSITVRGFKFEKKSGCKFIGQKAVYLGPYKAAMDEEGHIFPRGEAVEICSDTAQKLKAPPYADQFSVLGPAADPGFAVLPAPAPESEACCGSDGCC
ncbi:MAG: hypothetical protein A2636_05385 [Elusimicrobia bacterium RIFCSPHIGHO2_01_FULL_64_10]|nr:MAG: hypothetical protein A2636_05385 [Elusimicrobia bacterium RIFCSPHIGHO2_01_FULL_64_10]